MLADVRSQRKYEAEYQSQNLCDKYEAQNALAEVAGKWAIALSERTAR